MQATIIEILKIILPAIITGIFTFIVTKYNYNKNVPLDKMEIAYDKIYYPVYNLLRKQKEFKNIELEMLIFEVFLILNEYNNYVDQSTLNAFGLLRKNKNEESYENFYSNVMNKYFYLRRRLGYLVPNIFQIYTYLSKSQKSVTRLILEGTTVYSCINFYSLFQNEIKIVSLFIAISVAVIIFLELLLISFRFITSKIKK